MSRKILYISGTRADYGLMRATLKAIDQSEQLDLSIIATGMHLSAKYGNTVGEIEQDGFAISARVPTLTDENTGAAMARGIAAMIEGFVSAFQRDRPDIVLLLGDRGEMLAGAIAAIHMNLPVAHIHGGERSGTVDEPVRHAISKLSHYHFVATQESRERLQKMGEQDHHIFVVGAPGLVGLEVAAERRREALAHSLSFDADSPIALMLFHPVLRDADSAEGTTALLLDRLAARKLQTVALLPNSDGGSDGIRKALEAQKGQDWLRVITHFPRVEFVSWMAAADLMIGNSSAGIIEAATFGTPVVNIGSRQNLRERNVNVVDIDITAEAIDLAIDKVLRHGRFNVENIYGDGKTDRNIVSLLATIPIGSEVTEKLNAY